MAVPIRVESLKNSTLLINPSLSEAKACKVIVTGASKEAESIGLIRVTVGADNTTSAFTVIATAEEVVERPLLSVASAVIE